VPEQASGLVLFAHGSGSSRFSRRNALVAEELQAAGLGTLLFDLLTESESASRANVFDIPLLAGRLQAAAQWARLGAPGLGLGYFGASTGAAAALVAAAAEGDQIGAVVSRGGRPDLAGEALGRVTAPTLLIVGGNDEPVIGLNQVALGMLRCRKRLEIVPGASHLFEEGDTLQQAARLARAWFVECLARSPGTIR
jgi:pimeloyl-ACP methyl ester carboxylesterase